MVSSLNPEDKLPHPSLLAKFRVHRLPDGTLDDIIVKIVRQCVEKGIIEDTGISIDATHTEASTLKCTPERLMSRIVKKMFKTCESRDWCKVGKIVARMLEIGLNTPLFYVMNQQQKADEFKKKDKKRSCHEGKNGELKLHHGLDRAQGYGLKSMSRQSN